MASRARACITPTVEASDIVGDVSVLTTDMFEVFGRTTGELCVSSVTQLGEIPVSQKEGCGLRLINCMKKFGVDAAERRRVNLGNIVG